MPARILRVFAQTRASNLLESGPRQTLLPFPEGNWIMTNEAKANRPLLPGLLEGELCRVPFE